MIPVVPSIDRVLLVEIPGVGVVQLCEFVDDRMWDSIVIPPEYVCPRWREDAPHDHIRMFVLGRGYEIRAVQGSHVIVAQKAIARRPFICACGLRFGYRAAVTLPVKDGACVRGKDDSTPPRAPWTACAKRREL